MNYIVIHMAGKRQEDLSVQFKTDDPIRYGGGNARGADGSRATVKWKTIPTSAESDHPSSKRLITIDSTPVSKSDIVARLSGVRIPPSPPLH